MKSVFLLIIIGWILGALILQVVIDYNFVEVLPNPWLMGASIGKVTGSVIGVTYFTIKIYKGLKKFNFQ